MSEVVTDATADPAIREAALRLVGARTAATGRRPLSDEHWLALNAGPADGVAAVAVTDGDELVGLAQVVRGNEAHSIEVVASPDAGDDPRPALLAAALDAVRADGGGPAHLWLSAPSRARRRRRPWRRARPDPAPPADAPATADRDAGRGRHPSLPPGRRRGRLAGGQQPGLRRPSRAGRLDAGHARPARGRAVVRPGGLPAPRARRSPGRVLLDEAPPRRRRRPADGRDLRHRRRSRLPGPGARPAADAGRARLHRRRTASTSACCTSTSPTAAPSRSTRRWGSPSTTPTSPTRPSSDPGGPMPDATLPTWSFGDLHESLTARSFVDAMERAAADTDRLVAAFDEHGIRAVEPRPVTRRRRRRRRRRDRGVQRGRRARPGRRGLRVRDDHHELARRPRPVAVGRAAGRRRPAPRPCWPGSPTGSTRSASTSWPPSASRSASTAGRCCAWPNGRRTRCPRPRSTSTPRCRRPARRPGPGWSPTRPRSCRPR